MDARTRKELEEALGGGMDARTRKELEEALYFLAGSTRIAASAMNIMIEAVERGASHEDPRPLPGGKKG